MDKYLEIREYDARDRNKLIDILYMNIPKYFAESEVADFEEYLDKDVEAYFVALVNGQIVGGGGVGFSDDEQTGFLSWSFLNPKYHGFGFGKALLNYRIGFLYSHHQVEKIEVGTSQFTFGFYKKMGLY
jgi:GNAT superfamily N-acetyltransferase